MFSADLLERTQVAFSLIQEVIDQHGGTTNKLAMDDKGMVVLAAMGLPPRAHPDDAARAVGAAMAVQAALAGQTTACSIGIATGQVFCGVVGNPVRREYTVIGDAVNLSSRLMQAAAGGILCDAATREAASAQVDFDSLAPMTVKGKSEPVPVFRPAGRVAPSRRQAPLVGRIRERDLLASCLGSLRQGVGVTVLIEGGPGMGKSRLVEDFIGRAQAAGLECLVGAADPVVQAAPYHAWKPVFEGLLGLGASPGGEREAATRRLTQRMAGDTVFERLGPLLNELVQVELPPNDLTASMAGEVRAHNTQDLLVHLLERAVGKGGGLEGVRDGRAEGPSASPLAIVIEDAQWLDSASWALLRQVQLNVSPLLLVVALRPAAGAPPAEYAQIVSSAGVTHLPLAPLTYDETRGLMAQRLGHSVAEDLARLVHDRAEGNPFFVEELALALQEAKVAVLQDGLIALEQEAGGGRPLTLPETIQSTVLARLDHLDPRQQLIVKVASVIGRTFGLDLLSQVYPVSADRPELAQKLTELERLDLVLRHGPLPERTYLHRHETTREVAYGLLLYEQRRKLHRAVAESLEATAGDRIGPLYPRLAYHWARAEVTDKTLFYLEKAGERALLEGAYREAEACFREALELAAGAGPEAAPDAQRGFWHKLHGEALMGLGNLPAARTALEAAVALLGSPVPKSLGGLAWKLLCSVGRQIANRLLPGRGALPATCRELRIKLASAYLRLLETYFFLAGPLHCFYAVLRALNFAESAGPSPELARAYGLTGWILTLIPAFRLSDRYLAMAARTASQAEGKAALQPVRFFTGFCRVAEGRWAEGHEALEEAVELADRIGDKRRWIEGICGLSTLLHYEGQYQRRVKMGADVLYASARRQGDLQAEAWGLLDQAESLLPLGDQARAEAVLHAAAPFLEKDIGRSELVWGHGLTAVMEFRAGRFDRAFESASKAVAATVGLAPAAVYCFEGYAGAAETLLALAELSPGTPSGDRGWASEARPEDVRKGAAHRPWVGQTTRWAMLTCLADRLLARKCQSLAPGGGEPGVGGDRDMMSCFSGGPASGIGHRHGHVPDVGPPGLTHVARGARGACKALATYARIFPIARPRSFLCQGVRAWQSGRPARAVALWRRGLAEATRLRMPYETARLQLELARHLPATSSERETLLRLSAATFEQLHAAWDLERARSADMMQPN